MRYCFVIGLLLITFIYLNNSAWLGAPPQGELRLLAHRGVHQTYSKEDLSKFGCTASRIDEPQHAFLENTIVSISEAYALGADRVEIDIHPTSDGKFAVFHDWRLGCRTNGEGVTRDHTLAYLQSLDIGYGYTHDGGQTFPLRGKGVGKLPSLTEVLNAFPKQHFLINIKSNRTYEANLISEFLNNRADEDLSRLSFYGGELPTASLLLMQPQLKGFTKASVKKCAIHYVLLGWSGYVPQSCRDTILLIPQNYVDYFWGWPNVFVGRMENANTDVILVDLSDGHTDGIDNPDEVDALAERYRGIIWTDKIERMGSINQSLNQNHAR